MNFLARKKIKITNDFQFYLRKEFKSQLSKEKCAEYDKQSEISSHILKLRKQKKISQAELAKKTGLKQIDLIRIEAGKQNFSINTLERIAKVLGCGLKISITD